MWELDCKESWVPKNWCFWTVVLRVPWTCKEIKLVNPKVNQSWIDAFELWCWRRLLRVPWTAKRSVLGVHWKDWCWNWSSNTLATWCEELTVFSNGKDSEARKDWMQEEKGMTEDEMVGWHHWRNGHEFIKLRELVMDRGSPACCSPWGPKSWAWLSDWTELCKKHKVGSLKNH